MKYDWNTDKYIKFLEKNPIPLIQEHIRIAGLYKQDLH
jgi:hypothetical protein